IPLTIPSTAWSSAASSKITFAALPPSSSVSFVPVPASSRWIALPTSVEPVNAILSTSLLTSAAPARPSPVMMFTTPGGSSAWRSTSQKRSAERGVVSAGFSTTVLTAAASQVRTCHERAVTGTDSVAAATYTAPASGLLTVRTAGGGDYDVAALGAAAAGPTSDELAQGFVVKGERLRLQVCHFSGPASPVHVEASTMAVHPRRSTGKVQIVRVAAPTLADRNELIDLGFDPAEGADQGHIDLVLYGAGDVAKLRRAGFEWTTLVADAVELERTNARKNAAFAARTQTSAFPSGRTTYRHLADYDAEMKTLAQKNPGLIKLIELPGKSLEGRTILGVEVTSNVNVDDGKPVFAQIGVHHAREWPSGEHVMEWVYELVNGYGKHPRVTRLVDAVRTIAVPIQNPDGFNLSREASGTDAGN